MKTLRTTREIFKASIHLTFLFVLVVVELLKKPVK
jgi:hypothetical protein